MVQPSSVRATRPLSRPNQLPIDEGCGAFLEERVGDEPGNLEAAVEERIGGAVTGCILRLEDGESFGRIPDAVHRGEERVWILPVAAVEVVREPVEQAWIEPIEVGFHPPFVDAGGLWAEEPGRLLQLAEAFGDPPRGRDRSRGSRSAPSAGRRNPPNRVARSPARSECSRSRS